MDLIDEIHKLMQELSSAYYDNRPDPEFLELILWTLIGLAIAMLIVWLNDLHTKKHFAGEVAKAERLVAMAKDFEKNGDEDKFYKDFEELFYPNGYFEL